MTETKLPPDAGTICALLGIEAGPLADIFRHEVARLMRRAADRVEAGVDTSHDPIVADVRLLLDLIEALEDEWSITHPDDDDDEYVERELRQVEARRGDADIEGTEATLQSSSTTPPQSREDSLPGRRRDQ
jgi:hypothetical protein